MGKLNTIFYIVPEEGQIMLCIDYNLAVFYCKEYEDRGIPCEIYKGEEMVQIRNFKIPHDCHECVVKNRGVCDLPLDDVVKYPTYISQRHPNCPIEPVSFLDRIRRKKNVENK